jgi:ABC-2 type transport system ATP-binding protein
MFGLLRTPTALFGAALGWIVYCFQFIAKEECNHRARKTWIRAVRLGWRQVVICSVWEFAGCPANSVGRSSKMSAKVTVQDLWKHFGNVQAVSGVSFEIGEGEIFGLLGPNGAGKTTTVESVIGLCDPDRGRIEICGVDARERPLEVRQRIGAALQTTALQDKITPREALKTFGSFYRRKAEPEDLLEKFSLSDKADAPYDTLSGGQKQRLALAMAFVNKPEAVFLDEPTAGLDPHSRRDLHSRISAMKHEGYSVLFTTHYIEEAEQLCDRIAILDAGRIVAEGTPGEIIGGSNAPTSISFRTAQSFEPEWLAGLSGVHDLVCHEDGGRFTSLTVNRTLAELVARLEARRVDVLELHVQKATLEDVIIELTGSGLRE